MLMSEFGVLCHITCLNNSYGLGDFGKTAYEFVDFLKKIGATVWEVLPLNLTNDFNCPYGAMSIFSFDEMFVDLEELCHMKLLNKKQLFCLKKYRNSDKVYFSQIKPKKLELFECAYKNLKEKTFLEEYSKKEKCVLDYAYWRVLLEVFGVSDWHLLDKKFWNRNSSAGKKFSLEHKEEILKYIFFQYILQKQWQNLKDYANKNGVKIFGDVPAYCDKASVEVFSNPKYVKLNKAFLPLATGGAPADEMCCDMQDWGTCVYDWDVLKKKNYAYLIERIKRLLERYDILRLDHFMAYVEHFEIPKEGKRKPQFVKAGGKEFFERLSRKVSFEKLVVEDIGVVTKECQEVIKNFQLTRMKVLQFAFETNEKNPHLPEFAGKDCVYYTETHDSNTFMGFLKKLDNKQLLKVENLLDCKSKNLKKIQVSAIKKVLSSNAKIAMIPIQDLMFLDERFRMNIAGTAAGCWEYRLQNNFRKKIILNMKKYFKR